ncbi:hypothetical protein BpHYR1_003112 [Brachionus plicatilis]|uniref:Uncharacterized protein n=1 Tax=Brachionus plicatilis TaxID=10195 RepID=A0A3M7PN28_BRAPC|nr:hypothetical protein BpHYR1_003112 [Brachionus plicatilis]
MELFSSFCGNLDLKSLFQNFIDSLIVRVNTKISRKERLRLILKTNLLINYAVETVYYVRNILFIYTEFLIFEKLDNLFFFIPAKFNQNNYFLVPRKVHGTVIQFFDQINSNF